MFDTISQSFQRQDDQEVDAISCFFSPRSRRNCTLENDVIHDCKRSFLVAHDFDIIIFF